MGRPSTNEERTPIQPPAKPTPDERWPDDIEFHYVAAVALVVANQKGSSSFVARHLAVKYAFAMRIMERMEREEIVTVPDNLGRRTVLVPQQPMGPEIMREHRRRRAAKKDAEAEKHEQYARMLRDEAEELRQRPDEESG